MTVYNEGVTPDDKLRVQLIVNDRAEAMVLHNGPFNTELSWLEFDLDSRKLNFIMNDGDIRNFGIPVHPELTKLMDNVFQVRMVLMDDDSGEALESTFCPLIIHRA